METTIVYCGYIVCILQGFSAWAMGNIIEPESRRLKTPIPDEVATSPCMSVRPKREKVC